MKVSEVLEWFDKNRDILTVLEAEAECEMPRGTLSAAIKGTRGLPNKYVEPLVVLMDSLMAAPKEEMSKVEPSKGIPDKVEPPTGKPVGNDPFRYETTESGIKVRFRTKYPTHQDKTSGKFISIKEFKDKDGTTVKILFNGSAYKKTGNHQRARFAFSLKELS